MYRDNRPLDFSYPLCYRKEYYFSFAVRNSLYFFLCVRKLAGEFLMELTSSRRLKFRHGLLREFDKTI